MIRNKAKPELLCKPCGEKLQPKKYLIANLNLATFQIAQCDNCENTRAVTGAFEFGSPNFKPSCGE